ncbi:hypothetical protein GCM10009623_08430 [Nocardioides aestuarii]|uniref:Uncharacterized protein n=1 Tax=Nocardioides aestuarii TaxID=252231 RepID=A0ABW4TI49_9ACTN
MTDYPVTLHHRDSYGSVRIVIPAKIGVPDVDAQVDLLVAVQQKHRLAVERANNARASLNELRHTAQRRLVESMTDDGDPDLSGDAEVTQAEMTVEAAERITAAALSALSSEIRRLHTVVVANRAEVRSVLWKRAEKARDTLTGAAFAAEQAHRQLQASAGMVAGLDAYINGDNMASRFTPTSHRGAVETGQAVETAREALTAVNAFLDESWEPATKADDVVDEVVG